MQSAELCPERGEHGLGRRWIVCEQRGFYVVDRTEIFEHQHAVRRVAAVQLWGNWRLRAELAGEAQPGPLVEE